jgi:GT2 family glycosyltransferase
MSCLAIVVNYRCAADTLVAVASLRDQTAVCHIHVVDNSQDAQESDRLRAGLPADVALTAPPRNLGFGAACNLAFETTTDTNYVLLLNPDARLLPGALDTLIAALDADRRLAAIAPATWWDEGRRFLLPTLLPETAGRWLRQALALRWPIGFGRRTANEWLAWQRRLHAGAAPAAVEFLSGAVLLLRRAAAIAAGGLFDPRYFMFYEDADLSRRLRAAGFGLALLPTAQAVHHWRNRQDKGPLMAQSAELYTLRHHPGLAALSRLCGWSAAAPFAWLAGDPARRSGRWGIARLSDERIDGPESLAAALGGRGILALSPTPLGYPALFRPAGARGIVPDDTLWEALDAGRYCVLGDGADAWLAFDKAPRR